MKSQLLVKILLIGVILHSTSALKSEVRLPRMFSSNMVLQQGIDIPVWGWALPGEKVQVMFDNKIVSTKANEKGKWRLALPMHNYGGPFTLLVKGKNSILLENVMVGEVWICSGQSNMQWSVDHVVNAEKEVNDANYPDIRLFQVPMVIEQFPREELKSGEWKICTPETVPGFSAVGYFFGRNLYQELNVPIGLIQTAWGGTVAETWISSETIKDDPDFNTPLQTLQQMNLEKFREEKLNRIKTLLGGELPTEDKGMVDGKPIWNALDLNDGDWKTITAPKYWEEQGYMDIDGIGWYRKEIDLSEEQTKSNLSIHLGKIDDSDITWINGIEVGKTEGQTDKERIYTIESKYLKPGKNMIVVRVEDKGGNGGIYGKPEDQFVAIGKEKINISGDWKFRIAKANIASLNVGPNSYPTLLYNAMIHPLIPYGMKGAIWYQGESNASRAKQYQRIFPSLITDWRKHWGQGDFPFLFVSLANYYPAVPEPGESNWAELREAQTKTLKLPNTGMAVTIDIGEANDIHPKNKQEVGRRLALNAFRIAYGKNIVNSGPSYRSMEIVNNRILLTFTEKGSGLVVRDKYGYLKGFTVAGADKVFHWAKAEITSDQRIAVYSPEVANPVAVRYGWANNPDDVNLYNREGLPAIPFRTDDWPGITK